MAIYHASTKSISRSSGRSAVAAAAYRAGDKLIDERSGLVHDYSQKGGIIHSEIITPYHDVKVTRSALWNAAEVAEKRKDARTAREWIVALPSELNGEQRGELARTFAVELSSRYQVAIDLAIHAPGKEGDQRNHHAHLLCTTRQLLKGEDGKACLGDKASIELSDTKRRSLGMVRVSDEITTVRQLWEELANGALLKAGRAERIDSRSFKAQGIEQEPTQHLGPVASEMERRGRQSDRGDGNRQVAENNTRRAYKEWAVKHEVVLLQYEKARKDWTDWLQAQPKEKQIEAWDAEVKRREYLINQRALALGKKLRQAIEAVRARQDKRCRRICSEIPKRPQLDVLGIRKRLHAKHIEGYERLLKIVKAQAQAREQVLDKRLAVVMEHDGWSRTFHPVGLARVKAEKSLERKLPELAVTIKQAKEAQAEERQRQRDEKWKLEQSRRQGRGWSR